MINSEDDISGFWVSASDKTVMLLCCGGVSLFYKGE